MKCHFTAKLDQATHTIPKKKEEVDKKMKAA